MLCAHSYISFFAPVTPPPSLRHRLSRALTAWHASDGSARILLAPWAKVFELQDWEGLMARCILPKLAQAMQTVSDGSMGCLSGHTSVECRCCGCCMWRAVCSSPLLS